MKEYKEVQDRGSLRLFVNNILMAGRFGWQPVVCADTVLSGHVLVFTVPDSEGRKCSCLLCRFLIDTFCWFRKTFRCSNVLLDVQEPLVHVPALVMRWSSLYLFLLRHNCYSCPCWLSLVARNSGVQRICIDSFQKQVCFHFHRKLNPCNKTILGTETL